MSRSTIIRTWCADCLAYTGFKRIAPDDESMAQIYCLEHLPNVPPLHQAELRKTWKPMVVNWPELAVKLAAQEAKDGKRSMHAESYTRSAGALLA